MHNEIETGAADPLRDAKTKSAIAKRPRSLLAAGAALATVMMALGMFVTDPAEARLVPSPSGFGLVDSHLPVYHLGRAYCWYETAWNGPGWYWCGYAWHRNFGWAGGHGWHGGFPRPPHHGHGGKPGSGTPGKPGPGNPPPGNPGNGGPGKPGGPGNPRP